MDQFRGVIIIINLVLIALFIINKNLHVITGWINVIRKKLPVSHQVTPESQTILNNLEPLAVETLLRYLNGFNQKMSTHREYVSPSFLMEAYFPETQTYDPGITVDKMLAYFDGDYRDRAALKSYSIDSSEKLSENSIAVGVSRLYDNNQTSQIRYLLTKKPGRNAWIMDHISRNNTGIVVDQFESSRGTQLYITEIDGGGHLVYETSHSVPDIQIGDYVYVEGYLATQGDLDGNIYYKVMQMKPIEA